MENNSLAKKEIYTRLVIGLHALWDAEKKQDSESYSQLEVSLLSLACGLVYASGYVPTEWLGYVEVNDSGSK